MESEIPDLGRIKAEMNQAGLPQPDAAALAAQQEIEREVAALQARLVTKVTTKRGIKFSFMAGSTRIDEFGVQGTKSPTEHVMIPWDSIDHLINTDVGERDEAPE